MPSERTMLRRELLAEAMGSLQAAGVPNPRWEAVRLWEALTGETPTDRVLGSDAPADASLTAVFLSGVARRSTGEPLAHVLGATGFRTLTVCSDRRGLIPRPETEGLVELLLSRARSGRVADVGTGTGCLALSLAAEGSFSAVVGVELDRQALELARENRDRLGAAVHLVLGDLCSPLASGGFDALISNPPYLTVEEYESLEPGVRDWEPKTALLGGPSGLEVTTRLLEQGRRVLREGGWIALEVDCSRSDASARRATALGWVDVAIHEDLFGRERYLIGRRSGTP